LSKRFIELGKRLDIAVECVITDGSSPIGSGIGPALEARDILLSLDNKGPTDLINKSLELSGILLELSGKISKGNGRDVAEKLLNFGKAKKKMMEIIEAQGGDPNVKVDDIEIGREKYTVISDRKGRVGHIDNRIISRIARTAGAPKDKSAGIYLHVRSGDPIRIGDPLFTIYSSNSRKLDDAVTLANKLNPVRVGSVILGRVE